MTEMKKDEASCKAENIIIFLRMFTTAVNIVSSNCIVRQIAKREGSKFATFAKGKLYQKAVWGRDNNALYYEGSLSL